MWKVWFALSWLFVEGMGVPLLSEGAFGPLSAAVIKGHISLPAAYIGAYVATMAGNVAGFLLFWHYAPTLKAALARRWPSIVQKMDQHEPRIRTQVLVALLFSRFIGLGTFQVVLWVAGMMKTPWKPFLGLLAVLNLIWTAAWLLASLKIVEILLDWLKQMEFSEIVLFGALAVIGYFAIHHGVKWAVKYYKGRTVN